MTELHFANMKSLKHLDISMNNLSLEISYDWLPPFQLETISVGSCKLGPRFPRWLRNQFNYSRLNMSYAGITDSIPNWFWNLSANSELLDLSHNKIYGEVPTLKRVKHSSQVSIDLSSNLFVGPVPLFPQHEGSVDLSNNFFSGQIPLKIGEMMPKLRFLSLSNNSITGEIPKQFCKMTELRGLDLSRNELSGEILNCWKPNLSLQILDLSSNNITGKIPGTICSASSIISLHLSNNELQGNLPISLKNCHDLITIDFGNNKLTGEIPSWVGVNLSKLRILSLQRNKFTGTIPYELSKLASLQILDLSHNNLSGHVPQSIGNLTALKAIPSGKEFFYPVESYKETMILAIKRNRSYSYSNLLPLVSSLDLSENILTGSIPTEVTNLSGLLSLDLSRNKLEGGITSKFGLLQRLESLDLSRNHLTGPIPESLTNLTFLSQLNLSYNNLSGRIPSGNRLSTFTDPSVYAGNQYLCGFPLPDCATRQIPPPFGSEEKRETSKEMLWSYIGLGAGYLFGLWVTCCVLLFKKECRWAFFRAIDRAYDKLFVLVAIKVRKLKARLNAREGDNE